MGDGDAIAHGRPSCSTSSTWALSLLPPHPPEPSSQLPQNKTTDKMSLGGRGLELGLCQWGCSSGCGGPGGPECPALATCRRGPCHRQLQAGPALQLGVRGGWGVGEGEMGAGKEGR